MQARLFDHRLWKAVNDHFRQGDHFYVEAPRPWRYRRKGRIMFRRFPQGVDVSQQAAYLAKNLVNLQRFPDANKRTTSVLLEVFLESNGFELACSNDEYVDFLLKTQRSVPPDRWDGRSFSLVPEYIGWHEDDYHRQILQWIRNHTVPKA